MNVLHKLYKNYINKIAVIVCLCPVFSFIGLDVKSSQSTEALPRSLSCSLLPLDKVTLLSTYCVPGSMQGAVETALTTYGKRSRVGIDNVPVQF